MIHEHAWTGPEEDNYDIDRQPELEDGADDHEESCDDCGGTGWVNLNGTMSAECGECMGDGVI